MTKKTKGKISSQDPEYGVDSRYTSKKDRLEDSKLLMEARLKRLSNLSEEEIINAKLLQLKYRMEEFVLNPIKKRENYFLDFLKQYIEILYIKRGHFAEDINITPVLLSQILNKHREPKKEFILRLIIHSEKIYKRFSPIHEKLWFQVFYHEKIYDTIFNQDVWRSQEEKNVKINRFL